MHALRTTTAFVLLLVLAGCPKTVPQDAPPPLPPPPTPEQQLAKEVDALWIEATALVKEQSELLWAHWTQGAPLDLEKPALSHTVLFDDVTLKTVRLARSTGVGDAAKVKRLEAWLIGEKLARATAEANAALAAQEEMTTFKLDEKFPALGWRDLNRLLANEKSAVKRKQLWIASLAAIPALGDAHQKRDEAVMKALTALGSSPDDYVGVTSEQSATLAQKMLDDTEAEWKRVLEQLAKSELGLPVDKVTRADLPKLLRPNPAADASFPRAEQAAKATALLAALGLYGLPGLTLDLGESSKKNPLPLTVAPGGAADVRVSFRPAGGTRDVSALLGEVGRALALRELPEPRLADPLTGEAWYRLFADLGATPGWLKAHGVSDAAAAGTIASARALRLFTLRRAAGNLMAQHLSQGKDDAFAAQAWKEWSTRALGIPVPPEDAARWRLERDPLLRAVALLQAPLIADQLRQKLSAEWWADPASTAVLRGAPVAKASSVDGGQLSSAP